MKYKVYNESEYFGDENAEYFNTLEEAEKAKEDMLQRIIDIFGDEVGDLEKLREEAREAVKIEEDWDEDID